MWGKKQCNFKGLKQCLGLTAVAVESMLHYDQMRADCHCGALPHCCQTTFLLELAGADNESNKQPLLVQNWSNGTESKNWQPQHCIGFEVWWLSVCYKGDCISKVLIHFLFQFFILAWDLKADVPCKFWNLPQNVRTKSPSLTSGDMSIFKLKLNLQNLGKKILPTLKQTHGGLSPVWVWNCICCPSFTFVSSENKSLLLN